MKTDLFDIDDKDSLVRRAFNSLGEVRLSELGLLPIPISDIFNRVPVKIDPTQVGASLRKYCDNVASVAESLGFGYNLFTAVYEALKNGYEHGNNCDPTRELILAYLAGDDRFDVMLRDSGGILHSDFLAFIEKHRRTENRGKMWNFYEFSDRERPTEGDNLGIGTSFMHLYMDDVFYCIGDNDGLLVHMVKRKPISSSL